MKLADYMRAEKLTDAEMGRLVGLSEFGIRKLKYGERNPSIDVALRIQAATQGAVPPEDLVKPAASETGAAVQ